MADGLVQVIQAIFNRKASFGKAGWKTIEGTSLAWWPRSYQVTHMAAQGSKNRKKLHDLLWPHLVTSTILWSKQPQATRTQGEGTWTPPLDGKNKKNWQLCFN